MGTQYDLSPKILISFGCLLRGQLTMMAKSMLHCVFTSADTVPTDMKD